LKIPWDESDAAEPRLGLGERPGRVGALLRGALRNGAHTDRAFRAPGAVAAPRREPASPLPSRCGRAAVPPSRAGRRRLRGRLPESEGAWGARLRDAGRGDPRASERVGADVSA